MPESERSPRLVAIGERIRQRRKELGRTQEALAEAAELSKSFVSEMEGGAAAASGLVYLRVAQALDVQVQWLLTGALPEGTQKQSSAADLLSKLPLLSKVAEERRWSHRFTLDVAAALGAVVARRTLEGLLWEPSQEEILKIAKALPQQDPK